MCMAKFRHGQVPATDRTNAEQGAADLVVVGPEAPLAAGVVDVLRERRIPAFGPTMAAAEVETSKAGTKAMMLAAGIPTALASDKGLLFVPIRSGPEAAIRDWFAGLGEVTEGFEQKSLRQWKRKHPGHRSFTVLRHRHELYGLCPKASGDVGGRCPRDDAKR